MKITPNISRIKSIREMWRPRSRKEVQMYLGSVRSLLKWFPDLNVSTPNIADSITKRKVFDWSDMMEEDFLEVQKKVGSPAILSPFDIGRNTILYTDASWIHGLGYVLIQEDENKKKHLIVCGSSKLTQAQRGYSTTELELTVP